MVPRLRELAPPAVRGSEEAEFTKPRVHLLADPCINGCQVEPGAFLQIDLSTILFFSSELIYRHCITLTRPMGAI